MGHPTLTWPTLCAWPANATATEGAVQVPGSWSGRSIQWVFKWAYFANPSCSVVDFKKTPQNQCDWAGIAAKLPACAVEPVRRILAVRAGRRGGR